jgi:CSLREA domain-containing protein
MSPSSVHRRLLHPCSLLLGIALAITLTALGATAATFVVTTPADGNDGACDADCSLREAVVAANDAPGPDTIVVPAGTYGLSGAGGEDLAASGDLDLRDSVTINGAGAGLTIVDGGGVDRIVDIVESATVTISGVTLQNGHVADGDAQGGGAILWNEPTSGKALDLRLDAVTIDHNHAGDGDGGGILIEQDKPASSVVTISDSTIANNTMTDGDGGGLHLCCENLTVTIRRSTISGNTAVEDPAVPGTNGEGGGIYHCCTDTSLTVTDSTLGDNVGPTQGGGLYTCCGVASNTLATLERTTVSGNTALGPGPTQGFGGGIEGEGAVTLVNSTLSGNRAARDGGGIENEDVLVMRNVTIADNEAARGGGVYEDGLATTLGNTLFAGNVVTADTPANCGVAFGTDPLTSAGGNLSSDATCVLAGVGDRSSLDPLLGPLAANGGPTRTHAPAAPSPAIDGGSDAGCEALDQRGRPRPADGDNDGNAVCDIGAFELGPVIEDCDNGRDDDGDGRIDCLDLECAGQPICPERCDNCVDDDGDGAVDRDDRENCPERADGGGSGVGDPRGRGTAVVKCAVAVQMAGAKLVTAHLKTLQTCVAHLSACVQRRPGDPMCLPKAGARCETALVRRDHADAKARARIVARCAVLTSEELRTAAGLGYAAEAPLCAAVGVPALHDAADVAACLAAQHACVAQQLVTTETPRASELLGLGGLTAERVLPCAMAPAAGAGSGLGAHGKAVDACERAIQKAGAKLVGGVIKLAGRCATAALACRQRKPADTACLASARVACPRLRDGITRLEAMLARAVDAKCNVSTLGVGELLGATGTGFQAQADLCKALGVAGLDTVAAITDCVTRHHRCRAQQLLERALPRLDELLGTGGMTPSARPAEAHHDSVGRRTAPGLG